jgi:hypothetical protein
MTHVFTPTQPSVERQPSVTKPPVSAATRHLCVGAYVDEDFRRRCLRDVYYDEQRLAAPSYGFDLPVVLAHCRQAQEIMIQADAVMTLVLTIGAVFGRFTFVIVLLAMTIPGMVVALLSGTLHALFRRGIPLWMNWVLLALPVLSIIAVALYLNSVVAYIFVVLLAGICIGTALIVQTEMETLGPGSNPRSPYLASRLADLDEQASGNITVFSGYEPFVGAGQIIKRWSMAQRLVRASSVLDSLTSTQGRREFETPPFTATELINFLSARLQALANDPTVEGRMPGLSVKDRIYVSGTDTTGLTRTTADGIRVAKVINCPTELQRHYLACQVISWNGELVTTVHVHVALQGKSLYLEQVVTALPPCREAYRVVDTPHGRGPIAILTAAWQGLASAPVRIYFAPFRLVAAGWDALTTHRLRGTDPFQTGHDCGASVSVRELGSAPDLRNHLQTQDVAKYSQLLERRIIALVLDFLEINGVDTAEFTERAVTILNAGVVQTGGGTLRVGGNVVGAHHGGGGIGGTS